MNRVKAQGSALLFVLVMLIIVTLLANVVLQIMLNQGRLSQHRIWRVQALYAAQAAMVLTMERLYTGNWLYGINGVTGKHCIKSCPVGFAGVVEFNDPDLDGSIGIEIGALGSGTNANNAKIDITVMYQRPGTL